MGWETENANTKNTEDTDILCEKGKAEHSCMFTERQKDIVNGNRGQYHIQEANSWKEPCEYDLGHFHKAVPQQPALTYGVKGLITGLHHLLTQFLLPFLQDLPLLLRKIQSHIVKGPGDLEAQADRHMFTLRLLCSSRSVSYLLHRVPCHTRNHVTKDSIRPQEPSSACVKSKPWHTCTT